MGHIIKKLKARTAELTMHMSESLQLQQEVKVEHYALIGALINCPCDGASEKGLSTEGDLQEDREW